MLTSGEIQQQPSDLPNSNFKADLLPNPAQEQSAKERINSYLEHKEELSAQASELLKTAISQIEKTTNAQEKILQELAKVDSSVAMHLERESFLLNELKKTSGMDFDQTKSHLEIKLEDEKNGLVERQKGLISRIQGSLQSDNEKAAQKAISELIEDLKSTNLTWKDVISQQDISRSLIENIDQVILSIKIRSALQAIDRNIDKLPKKEARVVRARALQSLSDFGYSPISTLDLIEGRYDQSDPYWFGNITKNFLPIYEIAHSKEGKQKPTKKIIVAGIVALTAACIFLSPLGEVGLNFNQDENRLVEKENVADPTTDNTEGKNPYHEANAGEGTGEGRIGEGEARTNQENQNKEESVVGPPEKTDRLTPENSSKIGKQTIWEIDGKIPSSYFRTSTADEFWFNSWRIDQHAARSVYLPNTKVESDLHLTSNFLIQANEIYTPIPVPKNWELTYVQIGDLRQDEFELSKTSDSTYQIVLKDQLQTPQTVKVGMSEIEAPIQDEDAPNLMDVDRETIQTQWLIKELPTETLKYLDEIKEDQSLSVEKKARIVTNYVKERLVYSLDPEFSNFYLKGEDRGEYVARAWKVGYVDCDVANTISVAFLRYVGVDARLALGYANSHSLLNATRKKLESGEKHSWAEYYNPETKKWEAADATPSTVDPESLDELMELNGGVGVEEIFDPETWISSIRAMRLLRAKVEAFASSDLGIFSAIVSSLVTYAMIFWMTHRLRAKARKSLGPVEEALINQDEDSTKNNLSEVVLDLIKMIFRKKSNYIDRYNGFKLVDLLLIPSIWKAKRDIKSTESVQRIDAQDVQQKLMSEVDFTEFLNETIGLDAQEVKDKIKETNMNHALRTIRYCFSKFMRNAFDQDLVAMRSYNAYYAISSSFKLHPLEVEAFIETILDDMYEKYAKAVKKYNRKTERKKKGEKESGRDKDNSSKFKAAPEPVSKLEFIGKLKPEVKILIKCHEVLRLRYEVKHQSFPEKLRAKADAWEEKAATNIQIPLVKRQVELSSALMPAGANVVKKIASVFEGRG